MAINNCCAQPRPSCRCKPKKASSCGVKGCETQNVQFCILDGEGNQYITCVEKNDCGDVKFTGFLDANGNLATPVAPIELCPQPPSPSSQFIDNADGSFTHISGDGTSTTIDILALLTSTGGTDSYVLNADGSAVHTALDGTVTNIPAPNNSSLVINADGSATHTSGDGIITVLPAPTYSSLTDNGNGVITHVSGDGTSTTIDLWLNNPNSLVVNPDGSVTHTAVDGTITTIPAPAVDSLVANIDGSITHTATDGTVTVIPAPTYSGFVDNGDGTITHTSGDGTTTDVDICAIVAANCSDSNVVNADGSVTLTAVDGSVIVIPAPTPSVLTDNGDGSFTHDDGNGNTTTIPAPTPSVLTDNGDGSFTHDDGNGNTTTIPAPGGTASLTQTSPTTYTFDDGLGNTTIIDINEIDMDVNSVSQSGSVVSFTAEDGSSVDIDICQIVADNCNSTLVVNADGSLTYTDNAGATVTVPAAGTDSLVANADGSFTHTAVDGTVETIPAAGNSALFVNADGTVTHTSGDGTVVTIPAHTPSSLTDNGDGTYTHDDGSGNTTDIVTGDAYSETVVVAADGSAVDSNGNAVTVPAGALAGDILDVNIDAAGAPVDACFAGTHWRREDCYDVEYDAKGVATGIQRARHEHADPSAFIDRGPTVVAQTPLAGDPFETIEELGVLTLVNPSPCFVMKVETTAAGRGGVANNGTATNHDLSATQLHSAVPQTQLRLRDSIGGTWRDIWSVQAFHHREGIGSYVLHLAYPDRTVPAGGSIIYDRQVRNFNGNQPGEEYSHIWNQTSITSSGDIQHVD